MSGLAIGVLSGIASALGFALSAALQHRAAGALKEGESSHVRVLACAARNPVWCAAMVLSAASLALHGLALTRAPIAVVQPLMMFGVVFAVPLRAVMDRRVPSGFETGHVFMTAVGITMFILAVNPSHGVAEPPTAGILLVLIACGCAWILAHQADRLRPPVGRALVLGLAAGILFGVTAVLLKAVSGTLAVSGPLSALGHWSAWIWAAAGLLGIAINQRAYQRARLSVSLPVINIVNMAVAVGLGLLLFREVPAHEPSSLVLQVAGLALAVYGISRISLDLPPHDALSAKPASVGMTA